MTEVSPEHRGGRGNAVNARAVPRLLVLASTYPRWPDDVEPGFVHELAKRLVDDFEVSVLAPHACGAAVDEIMDGVRVYRFRYAPAALESLVNDGGVVTNLRRHPWKWLLVPGFLLAMGWRLRQQVRQWKPDVVHAHWLLPQGVAVAGLGLIDSAVPNFVATTHGADLFALTGQPFRWLKRFVIRRAAALTAVSHALRDELLALGASADKLSVQPMGVDLTARFTPPVADDRRSSHDMLFVGRLVEKKGLRYLIEAMPTILDVQPAARLLIAGFGPEESALRSQVAELGLDGKIVFLGAVKQVDLPPLYRNAALFVAPFVQAASGDREGLGLVSVEAAGCGCPIVVSDLPAVRDVFGAGHDVCLVPPGDARALASACASVLQTRPEERMQRAIRCREHLVERLDWHRRAQAYADLFLRLVP